MNFEATLAASVIPILSIVIDFSNMVSAKALCISILVFVRMYLSNLLPPSLSMYGLVRLIDLKVVGIN